MHKSLLSFHDVDPGLELELLLVARVCKVTDVHEDRLKAAWNRRNQLSPHPLRRSD